MSAPTAARTARDAVSPARIAELTGLIRSTTGETRTTVSPLTGEPVAEIPEVEHRRRRGRLRRRPRRPARLVADAAARAQARAAPPARPRPRAPGRAARPHPARVRQDPLARVRRGRSPRPHGPVLRPPAAAPAEARAPQRRAARVSLRPGQPRAQGRRRHHQPLELPAHDGDLRRAARPSRPATPSCTSRTARAR